METIADAVRPAGWAEAPPRAWRGTSPRAAAASPWFEVHPLPCGGRAIYEPGHFQEVISFLFEGRDRALLWDTGLGIGDLRAVVEGLTAKPLTVVNSHAHFDHLGGNRQFAAVHAADHPAARTRILRGLGPAAVAEHMSPDQFSRPWPPGFDPAKYQIHGTEHIPIREGHSFDLGGRIFETLAAPGHSPDSLMLFDRENSILLTGDTFYPAALYTHLDSGDGLASDFQVYRATMNRLARDYGRVRFLYCGHNEPVQPGAKLGQAAAAFEAVAAGTRPFREDARGLRRYEFDGFALVADPAKIKGL
ncbi:MAG: MBL fold metallo-hydrolase [Candidatus Adiutrix sp.]|jgi:glyoxylase-like metal-dependent hydrolase (beta-lactamase superfamily II)|nr:MBL fold metallo-hydrolase [Candidatus Adiutrix sp.]